MSPANVATRAALVAGVWLIYLIFGLVAASLAPLVPRIAGDMALGGMRMGLILGAWPLVYILAALPAGTLLDRIGVRWGLLMAAVLIGASAFARGAAGSPLELGLAVALFGFGGPLISIGAPKLIAQLFEGRARGTAMGIYVTGPYLGGMLALGLTNSLLLPLAGDDWRGVMRILGGVALGGGLVWILLSSLPAARHLLAQVGVAGKYNPAAFREVVGSAEVQRILLLAIGIFAINHGMNAWLPAVLMGRGMDPVAAGWWAAIPALFGVVAALSIPRQATPARQVPILTLLTAGVLVAALLLQLSDALSLSVAVVFQGLARGTLMTVAMLMLMDCRDVPKERLGMAGGMFFTVAEIGGVLGPVIFGSLHQLSGGFAWSLGFVALVAVAQLVVLGQLGRIRRGG